MLVVLAILALAAGLFATGGSSSADARELSSNAALSAVRLREARARAVLQQRDVVVTFDLTDRALIAGERAGIIRFGKTVDMRVFADASERQRGNRLGLRFRPDGSSSGATVRLVQNGKGYEIRVHWLTGRVSMVRLG